MSLAGLYIFGLLDGAALLFLTVYFFVLPELIAHGLIAILLLVHFQFIFFGLNLPLVIWNIYRYVRKPSGNLGLYDPAEIHNRSHLKNFLKESMVKLAFHLIFFFLYLYSMISALLEDSNKETGSTS